MRRHRGQVIQRRDEHQRTTRPPGNHAHGVRGVVDDDRLEADGTHTTRNSFGAITFLAGGRDDRRNVGKKRHRIGAARLDVLEGSADVGVVDCRCNGLVGDSLCTWEGW